MQIFKRAWPFLFLLLFSFDFYSLAQDMNRPQRNSIIASNGRPDIPGELGFDLGLVVAPDFPDTMKLSAIHCTYFSPFYKFEVFIPRTKFSVVAGISLGLEKYRFDGPLTLQSIPDAVNNFSTELVRLDTVLVNSAIKSSKLAVNYLEIPIAIRFRTNQKFPKNSFNISVGGSVGYMFNAHTKYKYKQENETKTTKQRDTFDLSPFRFGLNARVGFGNFNLFYFYSLNTLFQKDKGPAGNISQPMRAGISLTLF